MKLHVSLCAVVTAGVLLNGPTLADDGLLFGPPPVGSVGRAERVLAATRTDPLEASQLGQQTLPSPPARLFHETGPLSGQGAEPSRLPSDSGYTVVAEDPAGRLSAAEACGGVCAGQCCCPCGGWGADCCGGDRGCRCRPFRLFDSPLLRFLDIKVGGWLEQGITLNGWNPSDRFNGPVTFNDRSREYQMNQLYLFAERRANTWGCGLDIGGRVDVLYGTDHRFTLSNGLEDKWNRGQRFYGLSVPQAYLDVAVNDLTVRVGHFYTIIGYETVTAPNNFFYSHAYTMQYGEPFTHTGVLGIYRLDDGWSVSAGLHRGWDQWEDNNNDLGLLGGIAWTSWDKRTSVAFAMSTSNEDDAGDNNRFVYSLVLQQQVTDRLKYVLQHDLGYEDDGYDVVGRDVRDAQWFGINSYLLYELNPCWSVGVRYEWFSDDDGVRVTPLNAAGGPPQGAFFDGVPQDYYELALGLNWRPRSNVVLRAECRWDWTDPLVPVVGGPFNDLEDRRQFLCGTDLIVTF